MKANEAPETYPIQFKDKIDEYLWKEHHILGGCCSSIEEMKYAVAREVAEKLTDAFVEKAIGWIDYNNRNGGSNFDGWEKDFKNYMKGE